MAGKTKLELTWIGKDERPRLEPRILIEDPTLSHLAETRREGDHFDNMLIHGDNLLALKALETDPEVRGKVKCIFIDPPYNTGSAFEHYDDGIEHSLWLTMMRDRLEILRNLLSEDGSIWITIDDNEAHYLKVMADGVFGRSNFIANAIWQKKYSPGNNEKGISSDHDHVLIWAKSKPDWAWNLLPRTEKQDSAYKNPDNDPRGVWKTSDLTRAEYRERDFYPIKTPNGKMVLPATGRSWSRPPGEIERLRQDNRLWFGPKGDAKPSLKRFLTEVQDGVVSKTIWTRDDVGDNEQAKKEVKTLIPEDIFATPKPEKIVERILRIASNLGDLILDSFAGSGTTGAVAHKMGRRWIMVELGDHAKTHIVPRMQKVIDGTDKGGVTEATNWKGGGGYRFYKLAPSLLQKDKWGNWIISKDYNAEMLAEAMCKHFNYTYAPSTDHYWMHGQASESAYIYVTTNSLTFEQLRIISEEVGENRSLLICCMAYEAAGDDLPNLTIRKIPRVVLDRCEWGKDDYSLKIAALPMAADDPDEDTAPAVVKQKKTKAGMPEPDLFGTSGEE